MIAPNGEVVLLSALPEAHAAMVRTLRLQGVRVRIPGLGAPLHALSGRADLILVDLVHGTGLTREMVEALNRRRGTTMVVALHEGWLEQDPGEAAGLVVEGFCHSGDWRPLLTALSDRPGAGAAFLH